jgi:hypothetical protein
MRGALWLAVLAAPVLAGAAPDGLRVDARIAASAAAAQSLQGPLDGTWTLIDERGQRLFVFQIVDPVSRPNDLQVAWRDPTGGLGVATRARRQGDRLDLDFDVNGHAARLTVRRGAQDRWRGVLSRADHIAHVTLSRG